MTTHTLRHTCAMRLLLAGNDVTVIALWLGHEQTDTTNIYLHADMKMKETALAPAPPGRRPDATDLPTTSSSASCKASDYADLRSGEYPEPCGMRATSA